MRSHPHWRAYWALAAVCFFWGTTYLAIKMSLESFPPLRLVAVRFVLSGSVMLCAARLAGAHLPRGRELALTAVNGVLVLGVGNACLTFSELWLPSGLAALIITVSPFWMVGLEALMPGGERLRLPAAAGMLIGCAGAALLLAPAALGQGLNRDVLKGFLILQLGSLGWSLGSILQRRQPARAHPVISGAVQQLAAGVAFAIPALLVKEHAIHWTARGVSAMLWLVVFGSIVGYSAYIYALDKLPVAVVSLYTYVNPAVAVWLGWIFYREPFGPRQAAAMGVILTGVAVVKKFGGRGASRARPARRPQPEAA